MPLIEPGNGLYVHGPYALRRLRKGCFLYNCPPDIVKVGLDLPYITRLV